jgi:copper homeostasis protein
LELVRSLDVGGLTPSLELVQNVLEKVSIPVRVMLRENASMSVGGGAEMNALQTCGRALAELPIDGLVLGFISGDSLDRTAIREVLAAVPNCRATLHRAFDSLRDPLPALSELKQFPQFDRILTSGGEGSWCERKTRLLEFRRAAAPQMKIIVAAGLCTSSLTEKSEHFSDMEVHVGRAARVPQVRSGTVTRTQVAALKRLLG